MVDPAIIYEDAQIAVLDKPAGLMVHPTANGEAGTLADFLVARWPQLRAVGDNPALRPGIAHRLDRDTSGLMVVAKTSEAFAALKQAFQSRNMEKRYVALVHGVPKQPSGVIDLPIGHSAHTSTKRAVRRGARDLRGEREALTHWKVRQRYHEYTLLEVRPKTGRTHQIRVHLAAIGHPIVGDRLYGARRGKRGAEALGLKRQFLHASYLSFALPGGGRFAFESDLPRDLAEALERLERSGGLSGR